MALDPLTFPRPRLRRTGPPSSAAVLAEATGGGAAAPPRGRVINFALVAAANRRRTISQGPFVGPLVIRGVYYDMDGATDPNADSLEIGYAETAVTEADVVLTTARPYTLLTERLDPQNVGDSQDGEGLQNWTLPNTHVRFNLSVPLVVTIAQPHVVLALVHNAVGARRCMGFLTLMEAVSFDALNGYLGG